MSDDVETIVSFESPPVVEVVAAVALAGAGPETSALLASFWKERLRERFPALQYQPAHIPVIEEFSPGPTGSTFTLNFTSAPPTRLWAQSLDGNDLLQLQPNYFACNWRKVQPQDDYDRWGSRRAAFSGHMSDLMNYLADSGTDALTITQCEVTYINHITADADTTWSRHGDLSKVFVVPMPRLHSGRLEQTTFQSQYLLEQDEAPLGRLHVRVLPAWGKDGKAPIYVLELTARGAPIGEGLAGAVAFLDLGREAIDRGFVALTTDTMHSEWRRQS